MEINIRRWKVVRKTEDKTDRFNREWYENRLINGKRLWWDIGDQN